jgi:thymidylate synthase (FAD)
MKPYAELLEFNQPNPVRMPGHTRIRDAFPGLDERLGVWKDRDIDSDDNVWYADPERIMEFAGRWDYGEKNAGKLGETVKIFNPEDSSPPALATEIQVPIIRKYIAQGHESMIEMGDATFFIECSRVVSHELVRHRLVSYQQESQRFVKYDGEEDVDDLFFLPEIADVEYGGTIGVVMKNGYAEAFKVYKLLRQNGVSPQIARYVLPNAMRTRLIMKTNIREWRHIIGLRLDKSAQPEMQELMKQIYDQLVMVFPNALAGVLDKGRGVR